MKDDTRIAIDALIDAKRVAATAHRVWEDAQAAAKRAEEEFNRCRTEGDAAEKAAVDALRREVDGE